MKKLERSLGLVSVVAISISAMLGSGVFVLPGLAAGKTGRSVWLAYLLAGLIALPAALSKAELATAMPASGGSYVYLERIFGPYFGTIAGLALWASMWLKSAFALLGFGAYLSVLIDLGSGAAGQEMTKNVALGLLTLVVALNIVGIKKVGKIQVVVLGLSLVGLMTLAISGLTMIEPLRQQAPAPFLSHGTRGLLAAAGFVFVSFNGVTKVAAIAEEVKRPERNLPLGMLLSLLIATGVYAALASVLVSRLPVDALANDVRPVYSLAAALNPALRWPGMIAAALGVLTMTSMANAGLLAASRFPFAMSRDRLLPPQVKEVNARFKTPVLSILLTAGAMALGIKLLDLEKVAKLASGVVILLYIAAQVAVIAYRESRVAWYRPRFRAPFYPYLQVAGILGSVALLFMLGTAVLGALLAVVIPGAALFILYGRKRTARRGVVGRIGRRDDLLRPGSDEDSLAEEELETEGVAQEAVDTEAAVVVALFGGERSPEMLIDVASALAEGKKIYATHLSEIEETATTSHDLSEDPAVHALRRRVTALAEEGRRDVEFQAVISRDLVRTVHAVTSRTQCQWLVMQWHGRPRQSLTSLSPIGWLINHLDSNLAMFKDAGVRYVRKILVLPAPGPHDALVIRTADDLASTWNASLTLARFVPNDASKVTATAEMDYLAQLSGLCSSNTEELVIRGTKKAAAISEQTPQFDLVVMAAPNITLSNLLRRSVEDRITADAACSVLTLKTPRSRTHEAFSTRPHSERPSQRRISSYLDPKAVAARLDIDQKATIFAYMARCFAELAEGVSARDINDAFVEREREQNTAVGHGVALPHGTVNSLDRALMGVFTCRKAIDYEAPDGETVDIFFATVCPPSERETHLRLLSGVARLTIKTDVLKRLRAAADGAEVMEVIEACSRQLME